MISKTIPLGPTGRILHKTFLPRLRDIEDQQNIQKQTQRGGQNQEKKKCAPNERTGEISRKTNKQLNEMEASNLPDIKFKILVIRMLKELSENFKNMKKNIETAKNQS